MADFGPPGFSRFRTKGRENPEGVKKLLIEEKLPQQPTRQQQQQPAQQPQQQQEQQQPPRVQRKKVQSNPSKDPFGRSNKFDPFSDMAKE